jgi:hypothetical protein
MVEEANSNRFSSLWKYQFIFYIVAIISAIFSFPVFLRFLSFYEIAIIFALAGFFLTIRHSLKSKVARILVNIGAGFFLTELIILIVFYILLIIAVLGMLGGGD